MGNILDGKQRKKNKKIKNRSAYFEMSLNDIDVDWLSRINLKNIFGDSLSIS